MEDKKFELLLVKDQGDFWEVIGITYSNALSVDQTCSVLKASLLAIEKCREALKVGKVVKISKQYEFVEVLPHDLIIEDLDGIALKKRLTLQNIQSQMHQNIIAVCVIDAMEFLQTYMQLLNAGIFITDENREDKYLEIIEKSQEVEEPAELSQDATFEDEQKYIAQKKQYNEALFNLQVLEKYLNAYDKLFKIKYVNDILNTVQQSVEAATTEKEIDDAMAKYMSKIKAFNDEITVST